jgi:hypothetical protein
MFGFDTSGRRVERHASLLSAGGRLAMEPCREFPDF